MLTVTSYAIDRRNKIIEDTLHNHATMSEAVALKKDKPQDTMVFVGCAKTELENVQKFVREQGLDVYPTKSADRYVLGLARRPVVECSLV